MTHELVDLKKNSFVDVKNNHYWNLSSIWTVFSPPLIILISSMKSPVSCSLCVNCVSLVISSWTAAPSDVCLRYQRILTSGLNDGQNDLIFSVESHLPLNRTRQWAPSLPSLGKIDSVGLGVMESVDWWLPIPLGRLMWLQAASPCALLTLMVAEFGKLTELMILTETELHWVEVFAAWWRCKRCVWQETLVRFSLASL